MRDVSPSKNTTDKMPHGSNNAKRIDQGRPFSESSDAIKLSASASSDILRRGLQDKPQSDLPNKDLNQEKKRPRARNGKLWKNPPEKRQKTTGSEFRENEQEKERPRTRNGKLWKNPPEKRQKTTGSEFRENAREILDRWKNTKNRDLPQNVDKQLEHPLASKQERAAGLEPQTIMREHSKLLDELKNTLQGVFDEYKQGAMTQRERRVATGENLEEVRQRDRESMQKLNNGVNKAMDRYYGERDTITPPGTDTAQEADRQLATFLSTSLHDEGYSDIYAEISRIKTKANKRGYKLENGIQGVSSQPNTEHTKQNNNGEPASSEGSTVWNPLHSSYIGTWNRPSSFEQPLEQGKKKEEGRENKAIESASWAKADADAIKWKTEKYPDADLVGAWSILKNFPTIKIAAQLEKEYNTLATNRMILSKLPGEIREIFNRELSSEMLKLEKEYRSLEETFPKTPSEVMTRWDNIDQEIINKAQTIVNEWRTGNLLGANQVNRSMVINNFGNVIREATGLEKANTDVISVRQRLQELKEQFPKTPSEVWEKEKVRTSAFGG